MNVLVTVKDTMKEEVSISEFSSKCTGKLYSVGHLPDNKLTFEYS